MSNKQVICPECGTVAEVRRQKNGKHLRYMVCKHGHGGLQTRKDADKWERLEQDHIGTFGELPPNAEPEAKAKPEPSQAPEENQGDYVPDKEDLPEVAEAEPKPDEPEKPAGDDGDMPTALKIGLVVAGVLGLGGFAYLRKRKGA